MKETLNHKVEDLPRLFEREVRRKGTRNLPIVVPNRERDNSQEMLGVRKGEAARL